MTNPQRPEPLIWSEENALRQIVRRNEASEVEERRQFAKALDKALRLCLWTQTAMKEMTALEKRIEVLQGEVQCSRCRAPLTHQMYARVCYLCLRAEKDGTGSR